MIPEYTGFYLQWFAWLGTSGLLLAIGGNLLNDWHDREWDAIHRPERALPSGIFQPRAFLILSTVCIVFGIAIAWWASTRSGIVALTIAACILIYTRWHKRTAWSVVPMALCRALLPVMGLVSLLDFSLEYRLWPPIPFHSNDPPPTVLPFGVLLILISGGAIFLYVAGLSLHARHEAHGRSSTGGGWMARLMLIFSIPLISLVWMHDLPICACAAMLPAGIWLTLAMTRYRKPLSAHVSSLLAGIPLLDWVGSLPFFLKLNLSLSPLGLLFTILPLLAFISGRLLQKLAPAT